MNNNTKRKYFHEARIKKKKKEKFETRLWIGYYKISLFKSASS